jgi:putative DNA primase/helicase
VIIALPEIKDQCRWKWRSILPALGVDSLFLKKGHGPCPVCVPGQSTGKDRFRFTDKEGYGGFICNSCGYGDGITLLMRYFSWNFIETTEYLREIIGEHKMTITNTDNDLVKNRERLEKIRSGLKHITHDCLVGRYLANRGITILPDRDCYFHPGLDYWIKNDNNKYESIGKFGALVSRISTIDDKMSSYHITYISPDGYKADVPNYRKIMPTIEPMHSIKLFNATDTLCIAEGIETSLSSYLNNGMPVWSGVNAGTMLKMEVPESIKNVYLVEDADENFTGRMVCSSVANRLKIKGGRDTVEIISFKDQQQLLIKPDKYDFNDYIVLQANA